MAVPRTISPALYARLALAGAEAGSGVENAVLGRESKAASQVLNERIKLRPYSHAGPIDVTTRALRPE